MTDPTGSWLLDVATPFGSQQLDLELVAKGTELTGAASLGSTRVPLRDGRIDDGRLTFTMDVTDPMELTLAVTLTVDGDALIGKAKAKGKLFPSARITGTRTPG